MTVRVDVEVSVPLRKVLMPRRTMSGLNQLGREGLFRVGQIGRCTLWVIVKLSWMSRRFFNCAV